MPLQIKASKIGQDIIASRREGVDLSGEDCTYS